ncbi:MAG: hypothetical protein JNM42_02230 [Propionivibrio sp.]|uniref:DUF6603 domain-containing protein n=1 Tax=Propionivibrio sp. TaxID=2212460 RepID=UPI001A3B7D4C|nr:DUF6603 domain-containing protein [Propionivibrio sp.]MBL8413236.1 hypothetical protein [Propionivibrio sp.]
MAVDNAFLRVHAWFDQAINEALKDVADADQKAALKKILWSLTDPTNPAVAPPPADPAQFAKASVSGKSLSVGAIVVGEVIAGIEPLKKAIDAIDDLDPEGAKEAIKTLVNQVKTAVQSAGMYTSSFGLGKLLLTLSSDIKPPDPPQPAKPVAEKLAAALGAAAPDSMKASSAMGVQTVVLGGVLDKAFGGEEAIKKWASFSAATIAQTLPPPLPPPAVISAFPGHGIQIKNTDLAKGIVVGLSGEISKEKIDGTRKIALSLKAAGDVQIRWDGTSPPVSEAAGGTPLGITLDVAVKTIGSNGAISLPDPAKNPTVRLQIDELGGGISLAKPAGGSDLAPSVNLRAKGGKIIVKIDDALLSQVMGKEISVEFDIEALADAAGGFRLKDGTDLRVNLPIKSLPTGPFKLQTITFGIAPKNGFAIIETELSLSASLDLGPFKGSVERIGAILSINVADGKPTLKFKPPTGLGLSLDVGPVKGGGFLSFDPVAGEYAGALELKIASIGIKALGLLNTKRPPGNNWSLLLLIFGNFPPIQLSWGFTLTGIGGLIGVQHTADTNAMAQQLGSGGLDAVLFPKDVASNAPQIFQTLKGLFPFKPGGFIIGPMLEVGWGTPNLVFIRVGVLIEASQIAILGQLIIQIPPLVDKQLAILRLQIDFVGVIIFDPFKIAFDGKLRDSRVAFITLTGQFAFRAAFGDKPTFLISAGGFHPRFVDIPPDIPMPFDRIGAGFSIGIIGVSVKAYFAVTAATVQAGCEVKAWGDIGVASFDAGWGFDAICYLQPKFYFELDFRAWINAMAFGIEFGVRLEGLLKGPGRWRIRGLAEVDLGFFGSVSVDFDESFGDDIDTPLVTESAWLLLQAEASKLDNWSVQLPAGGESFVSLTKRAGDKDPVAHPIASLTFTQRKVPLTTKLDKVGDAKITGPNTLDIADVIFHGSAAGAATTIKKENFAAAQFFNLSQDDKLGKPSFEAMAAGRDFGFDTFIDCPYIDCPVEWETRDLDPKPGNLGLLGTSLVSSHLFAMADGQGHWMADTGAVGRSGLRALEAMLPADSAPLTLRDAMPAAVTGKTDQKAAVNQRFEGYWQAEQARASSAPSVRSAAERQAVELFELG